MTRTAKLDLSQNEIDEAVGSALVDNDEVIERMADQIIENMSEDEGLKEEFLSKLEAAGSKEAAERAEASMEYAREVNEGLSRTQFRDKLVNSLKGQLSKNSLDTLRARANGRQFKDGSAFFGRHDKNIERAAAGFEYKAEQPARLIMAMARAMNEYGHTAQFPKHVRKAAEKYGFEDIAKEYEEYQKSQEAGDMDLGGALVPPRMSDQVIPFLFADSAVMNKPLNTVTLEPGARLDFAKITGAASASRADELEEINLTTINTGKRALTAHKLMVFTAVPNELLQFGMDGVSQIIENNVRTVAELKKDLDALRGAGTESTPLGIRNQVDSANVNDRLGSPSSPASKTDILQSFIREVNNVETQDVDIDTGEWILHPRTKNGILAQSGDDDVYAGFIQSVMEGNIFGYPFDTTTQIPTDLDSSKQGSNDETEAYFAAWGSVIMGQSSQVRIRETDTGSAQRNNSAFHALSRDATIMRLVTHDDILLQHKEAGSVMTGVDFGADAFS